ncbi:MAG: phosphopantothenoylcysteine decarboxylase [Armatimonadota bacterium]|nr:phosphopantothenoylcysteine decarboxylase [Armatimonadota bacterium]
MAHIVLGVTGSVAAIRTPALVKAFQDGGHDVRVVATEPSLYFFDRGQLGPSIHDAGPPLGTTPLFRDQDEWPRRGRHEPIIGLYRTSDPVLHIELRRWADVLVVAPLDANTLAKIAHGLSDNLLTCLYRAWDRTRPILVAPAMNTFMWDHPLTRQHLRLLLEVHSKQTRRPTVDIPLEELIQIVNQSCPNFTICGPQSKRLACGDVGMGAMAEVSRIAEEVATIVERVMEEEEGSG